LHVLLIGLLVGSCVSVPQTAIFVPGWSSSIGVKTFLPSRIGHSKKEARRSAMQPPL
jgi:hypothetical protein